MLNGDRATAGSNLDADAARRARRAEQQRQRRAAARAAAQEAEDEPTRRRRSVRADQQRQRRAGVRQNELLGEHADRVATESAGRAQRRAAEGSTVQARRRASTQARRASSRANDATTRTTLSERILKATSLTREDIMWMSQGQKFTQDPKLALAYYYCCGVNPGSFVFANERLCGATATPTRHRLETLLDDYPKAEDVASCQRAVSATSSQQTDVWACVSCGRVLLQCHQGGVVFRRLDELHDDFLLCEAEKAALMEGVSAAFVRKDRQVFFDGEDVYFLIPDLVRDREKIPLCQKCSEGPRGNKVSVASGHDYGRVDQLPSISNVALACISPVRCFGLELSLSRLTGHAIAFPSYGPCELARVLPSVDHSSIPRVTFVGPMEEWRVRAKKFRHLYAIDVDSVYEWLRVLSKINTVFVDENIVVDDSPEKQRQLGKWKQR